MGNLIIKIISVGARDIFDVPAIKDQQILPQFLLSKQKLCDSLDTQFEGQEQLFQSELRDPRVKPPGAPGALGAHSVAVSDYSDLSPTDEVSLTDSNVERLRAIRAGIIFNEAASDASFEELSLDKVSESEGEVTVMVGNGRLGYWSTWDHANTGKIGRRLRPPSPPLCFNTALIVTPRPYPVTLLCNESL